MVRPADGVAIVARRRDHEEQGLAALHAGAELGQDLVIYPPNGLLCEAKLGGGGPSLGGQHISLLQHMVGEEFLVHHGARHLKVQGAGEFITCDAEQAGNVDW